MEALLPEDPRLLAKFAVILAIANGGDLNGKPMELLQAALKLDPNHRRSLALAGTAAYNNKDYAAAIGYWERLAKTYPPASDGARKVAERIAEARAMANAKAFAASNPGQGKTVH